MKNVASATLKPKPPTVRDMQRSEVRWTVPWAYNEETGELDLGVRTHHERAGTCTLQVTCLKPVGSSYQDGLFRVEEH